MRTNIVIDDKLMNEAKQVSGLRTKKETIETALNLLIKVRSQNKIKKYRGKLMWEGGLESISTDGFQLLHNDKDFLPLEEYCGLVIV